MVVEYCHDVENKLKMHYSANSPHHILDKLIKMSNSLSIDFTFKMSILLVTWKLSSYYNKLFLALFH